jgi:BirA family biotin operon repressor/biotin-[acetyl-CoA-carboxylase] ligase
MMDWPNGFGLITFETIDSTNKEASRRVNETIQPTWILSYEQTSGLGRRGRRWSSQKGNFSATLLMPISGSLSTVALHSFVASLALRDTLIHITNEPERFSLKWPNDVLMDECKIAGILLETCGVGPSHLSIGIGVNLSVVPESNKIENLATPPTCLGIKILPMDFLEILANYLAIRLNDFNASGFEKTRLDWLKSAANIGRTITARMPNSEIVGKFVTVDEEGALVLKADDIVHSIHAADIFF